MQGNASGEWRFSCRKLSDGRWEASALRGWIDDSVSTTFDYRLDARASSRAAALSQLTAEVERLNRVLDAD